MTGEPRSSGSYAYYSFPPTPNRTSPTASSHKSKSPPSTVKSPRHTDKSKMAPSPAAGKAPKLPTTPTKSGKNPASSATSKLGQSSSAAEGAAEPAKSASQTPKSTAKSATDQAKKTTPGKSTSSPKLPPRPKATDDAASKGKASASKAPDPAGAKGKVEEVTEEPGSRIGLEDNDPTEGDDEASNTPRGKVSQPGIDTGAEESVTDDLEEANPEPIGDDDDESDAVRGVADTTEAEETEATAEETADEATGGANGGVTGGLTKGAKGLAGKATKAKDTVGGAAEKAGKGDVSGVAEDTAGDVQETAEDAAGDVQGDAGDAAEGAQGAVPDEAGDVVDGVKDAAEGAEGAIPDEAGDAVDGVKDAAEGAEGAIPDEAGDAVDGVKDAAEGATDQLPVDLSVLKGLTVSDGGQILGEDGDPIGQLDEGDVDDLMGKTIGDDGEILDEDGDVIGRVSVLPDKAKELAEQAKDAAEQAKETYLPDIGVLKGLEVGENGDIIGPDGNVLGRITEGNPEDLAGQTLNENGEVLDEDGDPIGRAEVLPQEIKEQVEEVQQQIPDIGALEGLEVGESGEILGADGQVLGKITEGDVADLAGQTLNEKGEVLDEEGDVIGRAEVVPQDVTDKIDEAQEKVDEVPKITPDLSILEGKKINKKGNILDEEGEIIGKLTEDSDVKQCIGKIPNENGEILNDKGEVVGKVEIVEGEAADQAMEELHPELLEEMKKEAAEGVQSALPDLSILEGLKVNKNGEVLNEDGELIGKLSEGELADVKGKKINEKGEILDADGNVVGKVELAGEAAQQAAEDAAGDVEEAAEDVGPELPPLSILEGLKCNKNGFIIDSEGDPVGKLIEGDPKKISKGGYELDAEGQFWDNKGNVIGRAETLPVEEKKEEGIFAGLDGLVVVADGFVEDENQNKVGVLTEGDPKKLIGRAVDEDGDVIDKRGNVVGHAERYEEPEEIEPEKPDLSVLQGLAVNKQGNVIGPDGVPIAVLVEGNPKELAGKKCDEEGQIWNDSGKVIGRCELIPEDQREAKPEGPFAGLEGLVVVKGGMVEDEDGNVVGQVVEGDPKKLVGRAVDEDGDIIDKYGNVKGHAEPYEEEEEEPVDLSILAGKTVNKVGNVVDEHGTVFGRIVSGDPKKLAGKKTDGEGNIWSDDGKVIGKAELIPDAERDTKVEGPFSSFEGLVVGKDGVIQDATGQIVGRLIEGDAKALQGRKVDEDGEVLDKNGNSLGKAERWEPEVKERQINPMSGRKVNKEGEVRDADGNLIGMLTEGNLKNLIGKEIDDNGYVVDNDGNRIGECTLLENMPDEEPGPTEEELEEMRKKEQNAEIARKMTNILKQTLDKIEPVCKQITEVCSPSLHCRTLLMIAAHRSGRPHPQGRTR